MSGIIRQVYQSSGESTPSARLPEQYVSTTQPSSPLASHQQLATGYATDVRMAPIVNRRPRRNGMRYLYARGASAIPIQNVGADGIPYPHDSAFQPDNIGPIRDAGFNDALYQAGYPGYNLGLSFKVEKLQTNPTGGATSAHMRSSENRKVHGGKLNTYSRPSGAPRRLGK